MMNSRSQYEMSAAQLQAEAVETENVIKYGFCSETAGTVEARWQRKQREQAMQTTLTTSTGMGGMSNRMGMTAGQVQTPGKKKTQMTMPNRNGATTPSHDRFIPNRAASDMENANVLNCNAVDQLSSPFTRASLGDLPTNTAIALTMATPNTASKNKLPTPSPAKAGFQKALADTMGATGSRILSFKEKPPAPVDDHQNPLRVLYSQNIGQQKGAKFIDQEAGKKKMRNIPNAPERVLDAPDLIDDYYLNLLSWSSTGLLAVALGQTVYLWNSESGSIKELCTLSGDDYASSISFAANGEYLALGTSSTTTQIWDVESARCLRSMGGHQSRVSSLDWNAHIVCSGGRDSIVVAHDVRIQQPTIAIFAGAHAQEVCGLKWSPDGTTLATGGNDNLLCLWDARLQSSSSEPQRVLPRATLTEHQAAVKALAWCPHQRNLLASGGGTSDRCIKFWNTANGTLVNSVDTGSQVCSLQWNPHELELLSSHGFSENQLCLWKYPTMQKLKELKGHTARVLHMAVAPDGVTVCSAAADETLRFWKVFGSNSQSSDKMSSMNNALKVSSSAVTNPGSTFGRGNIADSITSTNVVSRQGFSIR